MRYWFAGVMLVGLLTVGSAQAQQKLSPVPGRPAAPDFTLTDVKGKQHRLSTQRGKVVFVNFWATWCPPCLKEMPSMQRAWKTLKHEDFTMYAVNVGEDEELIATFMFQIGVDLDFPLLLDRDSSVVKQWKAPGLPTTYIVDPDGRIAYRAVGERAWDDPQILREIRALMRPSAHGYRVDNQPR